MRNRVAARLVVVLLLLGSLGGATPSAARPAPVRIPAVRLAAAADPRQVGVRFELMVSGLVQPTAIAAPDDGTGRIFVVERRGTIRYYRAGALRGTYLDIRSRVNDAGGEQGLLGLAFHRDFRNQPFFYVAYTKANGALRVARFRLSSYQRSKADPATEVGIIEIAHPGATNHNGGQLAFNRDGYLYIGTGDGGRGGDPNDNAQNRTRLLGKILRIDVNRRCGTRRYCIPRSNPYYGAKTWRQEIWAYGLRNPWKFSFDHGNGNLYIGDVGQARREEVDRVPYRAGGWNLGWNCYEGRLRYPGGKCLSGVTYRFPIREYGRDLGGTVIGGYVYRGATYPPLYGIYVYGDFISGRVWGYRSGVNSQLGSFPGGGFQLTSFGQSAGGTLVAVGYDGRLFRVVGFRR